MHLSHFTTTTNKVANCTIFLFDLTCEYKMQFLLNVIYIFYVYTKLHVFSKRISTESAMTARPKWWVVTSCSTASCSKSSDFWVDYSSTTYLKCRIVTLSSTASCSKSSGFWVDYSSTTYLKWWIVTLSSTASCSTSSDFWFDYTSTACLKWWIVTSCSTASCSKSSDFWVDYSSTTYLKWWVELYKAANISTDSWLLLVNMVWKNRVATINRAFRNMP